MSIVKEFGLLAVVGVVAWLFLVAIVPIPHPVIPQNATMPITRLLEPVVIWGNYVQDDKAAVMGITFVACVLGIPAAAMAIRRLRRPEKDS